MRNKSILITKKSMIITFLGSAVIGVGISYSDLYLFHIMLVLLATTWFYQLKQNSYKFNLITENYIFFLIIMSCWYILSIFWAPDTVLALKYVFYIFCGLTITLTIVYFSDTIAKLDIVYKILSVLFILELIIALVESFTTFRMPISSYSSIISYFGKEPINYYYDDIFLFSDFKPPTGFHWNTNNLAIAMIIILPFFLCSQKLLTKLIGATTITIISIMTASRAVFLGLILIYCLYLLVIKKNRDTIPNLVNDTWSFLGDEST